MSASGEIRNQTREVSDHSVSSLPECQCRSVRRKAVLIGSTSHEKHVDWIPKIRYTIADATPKVRPNATLFYNEIKCFMLTVNAGSDNAIGNCEQPLS